MKIKAVYIHGQLRWRLDLGRIDGKRRRLFFPTEQEAIAARERRIREVQRFGSLVAEWSPGTRIQIIEAVERLEMHGGTLLEAVDFWIRENGLAQLAQDGPEASGKVKTADAGRPATLPEAVEEFIRSKELSGKRGRYIQQLRCSLGQFANQVDQPLHLVTARNIEAWLARNNWSAGTRRGYLIDVRSLFSWAQKRGYCRDNPGLGVDKPTLDDKPPGIWTVDQVAAVLEAAQEIAPACIPYLALGLFAGLRPAEADALTWPEVNFEGGFVEVKAHKSKTRRRRLVTMNETLRAWLELRGDLPPKNLKRLLGKIRAKATVTWPHDVLRHSFASYHLAECRNPNLTAHELGHSSTTTLFSHYRELVRPSEAVRFWALRPNQKR